MDEFALQRSVARHILKARPGVAAGMEHVVATLESRSKSLGWGKLREIDWDKGLDRWVEWMDKVCRQLPPPPAAMFWFESPSELNPALTSVSAWAELGSKEDEYGADEPRVWPEDDDGMTAEPGLHALDELDRGWKSVGWPTKSRDGLDDKLRPGVFATGYAYVLLLVINGLPRTALARSFGATRTIAVTTGWAEGDIDAVGGLKARTWVGMPKAKTPATKKRFFDEYGMLEREYRENPLRYLREGGDPLWRGKNGETLLFAAGFEYTDDTKHIEAFLDAGVDVNAVVDGGHGKFTFIDRYGAGDIDVIRFLIKRGATLGDGRDGRWNYYDEVALSGRCVVEHLELLEELGVGPGQRSPLHDLAAKSIHTKTRLKELVQQFRFWLDRGRYLAATDADGRTPLWVAIQAHAEELAAHREWLKKNKDLGGDWDYHHDRVAIELIGLGADPDARLKKSTHPLIPDGATPLMVSRYDDDKLVVALLNAGADPQATSAEGKTPLDYAQAAARKADAVGHEGVSKVVAALTKAMAKGSRKTS